MAPDPEAGLGVLIDRAQYSLFRLETRDRYAVESDGGDFGRYLRGEAGPDRDRKAAWHKILQADLDRGVRTRRVHVVRSPLSDYLRYEFEWGYAGNLAYEDIRIVDLAEAQTYPRGLLDTPDYWLVDDREAIVMHYDGDGRFLGFDVAHEAAALRYRALRDDLWIDAVPFVTYWDTHRQFWRANRQAA